MSASEIQLKVDARIALPITLASMASLVGRQSDSVINTNKRHGALVSVSIKSGATPPTADGKYKIYLLRIMSSAADDNAAGSDSGYVHENAPLLGELVVTNNANKVFSAVFDTWPLGPLGDEWAIGVVNETDQALNASDSVISYQTYIPEAQ